MQLPNLIVIGVFKAGTTSLFRYLAKHPDVCRSSKKEIHYFTPLVYGTKDKLPEVKYYADFFSCSQEKYRLEASPAYLYGEERVVNEMKKILPEDHKVLLILRNPLSRFISYYKHIRSQFLIEDDFDVFVEKCLDEYHSSKEFKIGHYKNAIREGLYLDYIPAWRKSYKDNLNVVFFDDLKNNPTMLMDQISKWLGIEPDFYSNNNLSIENKTIIPKYSWVHKVALALYWKLEPLIRDSTLKVVVRDFYRKINNSEAVDYNINQHSKKIISDIYKPHNLKLKEYLGELPNGWVTE